MSLLPYQERVIEERLELDEKLAKLSAFLRGDLSRIPHEERSRLRLQERAMGLYLDILDARVEAWGLDS